MAEQTPKKDPVFSQSYLNEDTIAALATPPGGALAVVRVSGPKVIEILSGLLGAPSRFVPRKIYRVKLPQIDDATLIYYVCPSSFTGEDMLEFITHGGAFVCHSLLSRLFSLGARPALPGEFSFRAVRNGKLSLNQAEAIPDIISASNETALALALQKLEGSSGAALLASQEELRAVLVLAEAEIDFSDQDLEEVSLGRLKARLETSIAFFRNLSSSFDRGARIQNGISLAFIGPPNAGKSSLFNRLIGEDVSIVSPEAGTTRDVVKETVTLRSSRVAKSLTFRLADSAGLRGSENAVEAEGVIRTKKLAASVDIILFVLDASRLTDPNYLSSVIKEYSALPLSNRIALGVLNKSDLPDLIDFAASVTRLRSFGPVEWIQVSAFNGIGLDVLIDRLLNVAQTLTHHNPGELILTQIDHARAVKETLEHLTRAAHAPELALFSSDLRMALNSFGRVVGETLTDDILGKIFSDFCIGK